MNRQPRRFFPAHLEFIRCLPSLVRANGGFASEIEAAHLRYADAKFAKRITGMGEKPSDCWTVPLTHEIHMSQHAAGDERGWWAKAGINPLVIAALLFAHSGDIEAGETIVRNARSIAPW